MYFDGVAFIDICVKERKGGIISKFKVKAESTDSLKKVISVAIKSISVRIARTNFQPRQCIESSPSNARIVVLKMTISLIQTQPLER